MKVALGLNPGECAIAQQISFRNRGTLKWGV